MRGLADILRRLFLCEPQLLSPCTHNLNPEGTACADDCPACRWTERTEGVLGTGANPFKGKSMTLKHYLIVAGVILAAMILAAQLARAQGNVTHAPTVEQGQADANV